MICRDRDEAHLRTLFLETLARGPLILRRVRRKEVASSDNVLLEFTFISEGRHRETIEQIHISTRARLIPTSTHRPPTNFRKTSDPSRSPSHLPPRRSAAPT
jgi:hypothetical protein